jgi:hypothetical protein
MIAGASAAGQRGAPATRRASAPSVSAMITGRPPPTSPSRTARPRLATRRAGAAFSTMWASSGRV